MAGQQAVEVWSPPALSPGLAEIYLSDGALGAAQVAFSPVPVTGKRRGDQLPADCVRRIGDFRGTPGPL